MKGDNGFLFFVGLVVISIAIGVEFKTTYGFGVLGIGLISVSLLSYLNKGMGEG